MDPILVKIFATALTLGQILTTPDAVKTEFDPATQQAEVVQILRNGCVHMRKVFDLESVDIDDLIATAMTDPRAVVGEIKAFRGIQFEDLHVAYRQFCRNETVAKSPVEIADVITFFNKAAANLPASDKLKDHRLPGVTAILDVKGENFAELYEPNNRRIQVPLSEIPEHVQRAFLAAEDKRFYEHRGVDERGVIRAFMSLISQGGRAQGGSTITQQLAKNLLVGDDVSYARKIREMLIASRLEATMTKQQILELYLNSIFFGRSSWGIEMAARSYYGKSVKDLTLLEGAFLAGLPKGPSYYDPDRYPKRAQERFAYVLARLRADDVIDNDTMRSALATPPKLAAFVKPRRDTGHHFVDHLVRETKAMPGFENLTADSFTVRSTINVALQRAVETALQDGLARYETNSNRLEFSGAEMNLGEAVKRIEKRVGNSTPPSQPVWQQALEAAALPLSDVHWMPAIVVEQAGQPIHTVQAIQAVQPAQKGQKAQKNSAGQTQGQSLKVGLRDGRVMPLTAWSPRASRLLTMHDVVYVRVNDRDKKGGARAELRTRPTVQGAAIVLENATGRVLAMAGSFSYPLSQLNRTTQSARQPGSALKPLSYLAALSSGLQPNTLVRDTPLTLPPIGGSAFARPEDYWSPKNYDGSTYGQLTLRRALENSRNLATAHLLDGGIAETPERSLDKLCEFAKDAQIYTTCMPYYPFVLGAQPVRPLDLVAFYAAIANEGARPVPYVVESIERRGEVLYKHHTAPPTPLKFGDKVAYYQLKTMMQGVLARGTAGSIAGLSPFVAGKTGTSEEENDVWFAGFSNEVSVVVWVGYDNADGKRRTLGSGRTGGNVAVPIFEPIMQAAWALHTPRTVLRPASPEAQKRMAVRSIDLQSGQMLSREERGFAEYFRLDRSGQIEDTQNRLVARGGMYDGDQQPYDDRGGGGFFSSFDPGRLFGDRPGFGFPQAFPVERAPPGTRYIWDRETGIRTETPPEMRNEQADMGRPRNQALPQQRIYGAPQPPQQQPRYATPPRANYEPPRREYREPPGATYFGYRRF